MASRATRKVNSTLLWSFLRGKDLVFAIGFCSGKDIFFCILANVTSLFPFPLNFYLPSPWSLLHLSRYNPLLNMYPEICVRSGRTDTWAVCLAVVPFVHCLFPVNFTLLSLSQAWLGGLWNGLTIILFSHGSWSTLQKKTSSGSIFCWVSNPRPLVSRFSGQGLFSASQSRQRRAHPLLLLRTGADVLNSEWWRCLLTSSETEVCSVLSSYC